MERLSKVFYVASYAIGAGPSLLLLSLAKYATPREPETFFWFTSLSLLYVMVVMLVLFYKMWAAIQDGYARTTPGKAVGFLFIPFFSLYWIFQSIYGFAVDYNRFLARHHLNIPQLPKILFLFYVLLIFFYVLLNFVGIIPLLGTIFVEIITLRGTIFIGINYFIGLAMVAKICDAVNYLPKDL